MINNSIDERFKIAEKGIAYFNKTKGVHNIVGVDPLWLHVFSDAYDIGYTDAISLFKWRKVEEELPEVKENHYFINVKKNPITVETISILSGLDDVREYLEFYDVIEWMYIPNIQ